MNEEKVVFDLMGTLVYGSFEEHQYEWRPGAKPLLEELKLRKRQCVIWSMDSFKLIEAIDKSKAPGLLKLVSGYYGNKKWPTIPNDFPIPKFAESEVVDYARNSLHIFINEKRIDKTRYATSELLWQAIERDLAMSYLVNEKIPQFVGSRTLVDDRLGFDGDENYTGEYSAPLIYVANKFGFNLIDPNQKPGEAEDFWAERVDRELKRLHL